MSMSIRHTNDAPLGDSGYFRSFYESHKRYIQYMVYQLAPTAADRDDIMQDTLLRLMRNVASLRTLTPPKAASYIAQTVRSACIDLVRRRHADEIVYMDEQMLDETYVEREQAEDPSGRASAAILVGRLRQRLSPRDWLVLRGKYMMGYSQEELGKLLGISPNSVRMALYRARENAKVILREDKEFDCP